MCMQNRTGKHLAIIAQLYGKTRVKCTIGKTAPCVYTVFLRVCSKPDHFYRVLPCKMRIPRSCWFTRALSSKSQKCLKMDPKIDPKIEPESPKHRKNPGNYACACKNTRVLPGKSTLRSPKMIPKWGSRKRRVFDAFCEPSKTRFTRVLPSKMSIGRKPILKWNGKRGLICQTTHVPDCFRHLNCWTHFPHVHKGRLHVSMHVYGHLRSLRIFLYYTVNLE